MEKIINIHIEKLPGGVYLATSEDIPGLVAQGRTATEALEMAREDARKLLELEDRRSRFIAHNIALDDGTQTRPDQESLLSQEPWVQSAKHLLRVLFPNGLNGVSIVDLGCLEGGYSVEFARLGMNALGLEVREANFHKCRYVRDHLSLPNLRFEQDDVWNLERYGQFDVIFCCGLLYHLNAPAKFIRLMSSLCTKAVIINTHFAPEEPSSAFSLSEIEENEGLSGRWFWEHDGTAEQRDNWPEASWENRTSFWLRRPDLLSAIKSAGFPIVFEQFDMLGDIRESMTNGFYRQKHRSTFVGLK